MIDSSYTTEIRGVTQIVFRPQRLSIARAPDDAVILDLRIRGQSQLVGEGLPWQMFSLTAGGTQLDLPTVNPGEEIVLVVGSEEGGPFQAVLFGMDEKGTQLPLGLRGTLHGVEPLVEVAREKLGLPKRGR